MNKWCLVIYLMAIFCTSVIYGQEAEILKSIRISSKQTSGLGLPFQGVEKDSDGNYYVAFASFHGRDIYVDDLKIKNDTLPNAEQNDVDKTDFVVFMKFDPDLNLDTIMKIKNTQWRQFEYDIVGNRIFVKIQFVNDMMINDEVYLKEDWDNKHIIWELDQNFNIVNEIKVEEIKDHPLIEVDFYENNMYVISRLSFFDNFYYNDKALENYYYISPMDSSKVYSSLSNFVMRYDMETDSVLNAWRFGGTGLDHMLYGMVVDDFGNVIVTGTVETLKWFTFDDVDSMQTAAYFTGFLGKYTAGGELIFGHLYNDALGVFNNRVLVEGNDVYVRAEFRGDTLMMAGHTFDNREKDGSINGKLSIFYKYNSQGEIVWANSLNGEAESEHVRNIKIIEDKVYLSIYSLVDIEKNIQNNTYIRENELNTILVLDKNSGEILNHLISTADEEINSNFFHYVDRNEEGNVVMLYQCEYEHELWGNEFDSYSRYGGDFHFMELDMELLTSIYNYESDIDMISIFPNPVGTNSTFELLAPSHPRGTWKLLSTTGLVLREGDVSDGKARISTVGLQRGAYIVHYNDGVRMQNNIIMVQ